MTKTVSRPRVAMIATLAASALVLTACGSDSAADTPETPAAGGAGATEEGSEAGAEATSVEIEDNNGTHTIALPPQSVVATDNRTFETLDAWGVELTAAAVALMPDTLSYAQDSSVIDLGNHREPDLEAVVAAEPDLIINGQRFADYRSDFERLAPDAVVLDLDPREDEPLDAELKRQITVLGTIFGKEADAESLNADLDAAVERAKAAYDPADTVMAVITSGGEIGYVAPGNGRTIGPIFDLVGMTPALETDGSEDHQGDDISVEAIASSNPDWILVMDRDAAVAADDPNYSPAAQVLENSEALANVTAVKEGRIVYMPSDTYTNEGIQTYTEYLNSLADAFENAG
ncbi:siderophore ABC transporter substrate-binding protein [Ornithinimicrobium sufpigmenti]|uniref:siderophore ABC transporter substrate-binding protein n=1 Tax=Ornithinimicrobium sufpigmenti TaxID=2508882 RepID=UPI001EDF7B3B|nr:MULTISPECIES: ABC transporter substrate-binding protein [unclassified Ornithinimicrobium]